LFFYHFLSFNYLFTVLFFSTSHGLSSSFLIHLKKLSNQITGNDGSSILFEQGTKGALLFEKIKGNKNKSPPDF